MTASSHGWLASSASDAQWWPWRNRSGHQLPRWWTTASVTQVVPVKSTGDTFSPRTIQNKNHLSQGLSLSQAQATEDFTARGQSQSIFLCLYHPLPIKNILLSPKNVTYQWQWGCKPEGGRGKKCLYLLSSTSLYNCCKLRNVKVRWCTGPIYWKLRNVKVRQCTRPDYLKKWKKGKNKSERPLPFITFKPQRQNYTVHGAVGLCVFTHSHTPQRQVDTLPQIVTHAHTETDRQVNRQTNTWIDGQAGRLKTYLTHGSECRFTSCL